MANIFIDGDEIAKLKDILETIINPSIQSFQPNADFKGGGILQFAFPATKNTVYYRSIAPSPTVWNELGEVLISLLSHLFSSRKVVFA